MQSQKKSFWNSRLFRDSFNASITVLVVLVIAEIGNHFSQSTWIWHIQG